MVPSKHRWSGSYCCIPGCKSSSGNGDHLYHVPDGKNKKFGMPSKEWAQKFHQVVFKYRFSPNFKSKVEDGKVRICGDHFEDEDIQKTNKRSWIKFGALPTKCLPRKSHEVSLCPPRRIVPKYSSTNDCPSSSSQSSIYNSINEIITAFESITLKNWRMHRINAHKAHFTYYSNHSLHATPEISLLICQFDQKPFYFSCAFAGVYSSTISSTLSLRGISISILLKNLVDLTPCFGYNVVSTKSSWIPRSVAEIEDTGEISLKLRYISSQCEIAYSYAGARPNICSTCMRLHVHDQDSDKRKTNRFEKLKHVPLANRCTYATASKERLVALANINRQRLSDLENEVRKAGIMVSTNMSSMIEGLSEDEFLKDWWEVQQHLQKSNSKFGRRYPPSIIRYCLMLYAKSPSAYKFIQRIMVLPAPRTLQNSRNAFCGSCEYGFQKSIAARIQLEADSAEKECDKMVVLAVDEMSIKEDLVFKSSTGEVTGYVDFGNECINNLSKSYNRIANHVLAIYVRGITNHKLDGVLAYYPTAGINAEDLVLLLCDLLVEIPHQTHCVILAIVFDGLAANRSAINLMAAKEDRIPYRMRNPADVTRYIYMLPDPPHLLKTCRNNLLSTKKNLWNGEDIYMEPVKQLIREDLKRGELRLFHKITESHINPSPWEKMSVRIAAQTLSYTVGKAIENRGFSALAEFILNSDKWFDCMNSGFQNKNAKPSRQPFYNIYDKRIEWLEKDFLKYLDDWEEKAYSRPLVGDVNRQKMLLSDATRNGLRMASVSMAAIIRIVLSSGASYVLPRRINQDPLEAYFGHQRDRGSRTGNPTLSLFTSNSRSIDVVKSFNSVFGSNVAIKND